MTTIKVRVLVQIAGNVEFQDRVCRQFWIDEMGFLKLADGNMLNDIKPKDIVYAKGAWISAEVIEVNP